MVAIAGAVFLDKTDGNYLVIFALPTVFRQGATTPEATETASGAWLMPLLGY